MFVVIECCHIMDALGVEAASFLSGAVQRSGFKRYSGKPDRRECPNYTYCDVPFEILILYGLSSIPKAFMYCCEILLISASSLPFSTRLIEQPPKPPPIIRAPRTVLSFFAAPTKKSSSSQLTSYCFESPSCVSNISLPSFL